MSGYNLNSVEYIAYNRIENEVKPLCMKHLYGGFIFDGEIFDSSEYSIQNIIGKVTLAVLCSTGAVAWDINTKWILANNNTYPIPDIITMFSIGVIAAKFR